MPANERQRAKLQAMAFAIADAVLEEFGEGSSLILLVSVPERAAPSVHELHFLGTVSPVDSLTILREAMQQCADETVDGIAREVPTTPPN